MIERKSTRGQAPIGTPTQTRCSGHEACNNGTCNHRPLPWWHTKSGNEKSPRKK